MSYPVFYVPAGDVLPIFFGSYDGGTGASSATTGLAVTDIEIYKDGSVTQRASDAGYTLLDTDGLDFDGLTGINGFSIDTGDNTDASFYTVGAWFTVVVSAVTIDAQTVSFIAAQFRIMPAESSAGVPKVDVSHFGGSAGTFASGRAEVNLSHIAGSAVSTTTAQLGVNVVQVSGDGTAADNLETAFDDTAGTVPWLGVIDQGTAQAGSTSSTFVARAGLSLANDVPNGSQIRIVSGTGAGQSRFTTDFVGATDTFTVSPDWTTTPDNTSVYKIDAVAPAVTGGSSPTAAEIADAVWDEAQGDHVGAGTFGETATEIASILVDTGTTLDGRIPAALVSGRMDCSVGAMAANVMTAAAAAADLTTELQSGLATSAALATVDTVVDAIKAVTDLLPDAGALTSLATQASVNTIDDLLDTEVGAIKTKTDQLTFTVANVLDANVQRINDVAIVGDGSGTPFQV